MVVCVVRGALSDVPGNPGAAEHDAGEGVIYGVGGRDDPDAFGAREPNAVVGEELLRLVDAVAELGRPLVDVVEKAQWEVLVNPAGTDIGCMQAGSRYALVEFLGWGVREKEEKDRQGRGKAGSESGVCELP